MYDLYIALGDSMSIDLYPQQAAESAKLATRLDIGAASLLLQNDDFLFPEFSGNDLLSRMIHIGHTNLAVDGAIAEDVVRAENIKLLNLCKDKKSLVTLTAGGNDLIHAFRTAAATDIADLPELCADVAIEYSKTVDTLRELLPNATFILTTVYDPTDGTGMMPGNPPMYSEKFPMEYLVEFNKHVQRTAESNAAAFADVYSHFKGHGAQAGSDTDFWYWKPSPIEPSHIGASEIRRVWLSALEKLNKS